MKDDLNELFAETLIKNNTDEIQKSVEKQLDKLKTELFNKINTVTHELNTKTENINNILKNKPLVLNLGSVKKPDKQIVHKQFYTIVKILESAKRINKNIMLVGGAGSGKNVLTEQVAKALKLNYYPISVGIQTTKSDLIGYLNVNGDYISTPIREAYEKGGLLFMDELDASHPGVLTILNALLANEQYSFPDKTIHKHKNFVCMCACNTYGNGGTTDYIGRNKLDGATLDRFVVVPVDYDTELEKNLVCNDRVIKIINKIRNNAQKSGTKIIISPRASMQIADLLDNGFFISEVLDMVIFKGCSDDVKNKLLQGVELKKEKKVEKDNNTPIKIIMDFATRLYKIEGVTENIAFLHNLDWENPKKFNLYINIFGEYSPVFDKDGCMYLNANHEFSHAYHIDIDSWTIGDFYNLLGNMRNVNLERDIIFEITNSVTTEHFTFRLGAI